MWTRNAAVVDVHVRPSLRQEISLADQLAGTVRQRQQNVERAAPKRKLSITHEERLLPQRKPERSKDTVKIRLTLWPSRLTGLRLRR